MFDDFEIDNGGGDAEEITVVSKLSLQPAKLSSQYIGEDSLEKHLLSLYNEDRLPHALIFSGLKGIGKSTFAYRLTRFLLKESEKSDSAMGGGLFGDDEPSAMPVNMTVSPEDPIFSQIESGAHLDFKLIEPDFKPNTQQKRDIIDVEQLRKLSDFMKLKASRDSGWRVALIDDADLMNRNAQNALLKLLEEPPKKTVLILVCHRLGAMLPTIRSRCQTFNFDALDDELISQYIEEANPAISPAELDLILSMANGSLGKALRLVSENAFEILSELQTAFSAWPNLDWPNMHLIAERYAQAKDDITRPTFKEYMLWLFAECIKTKVNRSFISETWLKDMTQNYDLKQLIKLQDDLKQHFVTAEAGNLDHIHYYLGAFYLLPNAQS